MLPSSDEPLANQNVSFHHKAADAIKIAPKLEDDVLPGFSEEAREAIRKQQRRRWERKHGE